MKDPEHINGPRFTIVAGASVVITPNHRPQSAYAHQITKPTYFDSVADCSEPDHLVFRSEGWTIRVHQRDVVIRPTIEALSFGLEFGQQIVARIDRDGKSEAILPYHDGPAEVGKTMLDITSGDQLWVRGRVWKVSAVYVHRSNPPANEHEPVSSGRAFLQSVAALP